MPVARPVAERFWEKVEKTETCWLWTGSCLKSGGYGQLSVKNRSTRAHRFAYELLVGPIPEGLEVCHRCDNPPCVNPEHLFLGTHHENALDMAQKGRGGRPPGLLGDRSGMRTPERRARREEVLRLFSLGWRQVDIAREVGMGQSNVSHIVRGKSWA